ncbi:MAG: polysaccharide biosynthesis tyrosine autokinase [Sinimarinibacterium sp.]|jgi:capsular exopolysaccharide synthesis family protein
MKPEIIPARESEEDLIDFPELVRTFGRYKWGIAGLTVLAATIAALIAFTLPPVYRGSVSLLVEAQNQRVATLQDVYASELPEMEFLGSQIVVLQSREIARRVVERLNLMDHEEFAPQERLFDIADLRRFLPFLPDDTSLDAPPTEDERRETVIDEFTKRVTVEPYGRTRVIKVHFDAQAPDLAAQVANTLADLYLESGLQARLDATTKATSWLTDKLAEIQSSLQQAEANLQKFREQEQLVSVGGTRGLTEDEVLDYSRRHREAQRRRADLQNSYQKIQQAGSNPQRLRDISNLLLDPVVQRTNESYLSAREVVKQLEDRYGPKHPQMSTARARLDTAEAALNEQLRIAASGVKAEYEIALESERGLARQLESARDQARNLDRKDYELSVLQRNVTTYRELYDSFLTRFKETDVAGSYQDITARIIDPAMEPRLPESPKKKQIVLLAALGGLVAGILLAILHHLLSEGIASAEELESITQLPVLGVLPLVSGFSGLKTNLAKYFLGNTHTPFSEGVRSTCASLRLGDAERTFKNLLVSSSQPSEGKSSVSSSLALTLGTSEKVVLVEGDLRKPSLARLFKIGGEHKGLAQLLAGDCMLDECLYWYEPGAIWILMAGRVPSNPSELLASPRLQEALTELGRRFDRVILDSPPIQAAADAMVLGRQCDAALFVVKSDATSRRSVRNSLKQLRFAAIPVVGSVINQVDVRRNPHYADSYHYVYGYYGKT